MKRALVLLVLAALLSGCATAVMSGAGGGDREWSASQADARVTRDVRTAIYRDAVLEDARISVATQQGIVTLSGHVAETSHVDRARRLAAGIAGVKQVIIQLRANGAR